MTQLKREDWLKHGLDVVVERGIEGLTIDGLCQQLGVTKGSFYHHFKNAKTYAAALLEYWEAEYTVRFIEHSSSGATAQERLARLNDLVVASFGQYEVPIRAWAQSDPFAREVQIRVDQQRVAYLTELYNELVEDHTQAQTLAQLVYTTLIGSTTIMPPLKRAEFEQLSQLLERLILTLIQEGS